MVATLIATGFGLVGSVVASVILGDVGLMAWIRVGVYAIVLLLTAAIIGWAAERVRRSLHDVDEEQEDRLEQESEPEREWTSTVFDIANRLNATLDYERVIDITLDLSARAMLDFKSEDVDLVSAFLLFDDGILRVASARRLTHKDRRTCLSSTGGVIQRALISDEPCISDDPANDPELRNLEALCECATVLCVPLTTGLDTHGAVLFAHPEPNYFNHDRVSILNAVTQQAVIAMQNARLYRELEMEKERITEIQEDARKKLARDLHDGPTQTIASIAMRVNFARRLIDRDPIMAAEELDKVEDIARSTSREIRHMLFTLRPLVLESKGLLTALDQLAVKMRETHRQNVIIDAEFDVAEGLDIGKQSVVFYIAEEAVNNARKHAVSKHIWVRLERRGDQFALEVEDDGVGFNVGAVDSNYEQRGSLGMVNMRERAALVNGTLNIRSTEGEGTCITLLMPLTETRTEEVHQPG
jgi:signal transduction histidine kinase